MKIVVLGGAGDMGAEAVRDLLKYDDIQEITIADINVKSAEKIADTYGENRVKVARVDAEDHQALVKTLAGHDVAAGALGPFYKFEKPIVEAALAAGVDYVSLCDDQDAVADILPLDEEAKAKGRKILTGMGWTPGISNILARKGYDSLDQTESIWIYWGGSLADTVGLAVILHTVHIFSGNVICYSGGKSVEIRAGTGQEAISFPDPLGTVQTFHLGHPEPITIPRYLKHVGGVCLKGGLIENYLNSIARFLNRIGLTNSTRKESLLAELVKTLLPILPMNKKRAYSGIRVDVQGYKDDEKVLLSYAAVDKMRRLAGLTLSIGVYLMAQGKISRTGVYAPEADNAVNPDEFLAAIKKQGIEVEETTLQL